MTKVSESTELILDEAAESLATVLLLHELPDGTSHVDWMLARDAVSGSRLATFRMAARIDQLTVSAPGLAAERLADHRSEYLDYEGPVSGGRGRVRRLRRGRIVKQGRSINGEEWLCILWEGGLEGEVEQKLRIQQQNQAHPLIFCDSIRRCTSERDS